MRHPAAVFPLLLTVLVTGQQPNDKFTLLGTRTLADGRELHSIQEHGDELPDLPTEDEEVFVAIDEQGKVLPGYEHLLQPKVIIINRQEIEKLNNSKPVHPSVQENEIAPILPRKEVPPVVLLPNSKVLQQPNDIDQETEGADYVEVAVPKGPKLPTVQDYVDSKEKDPEVDTGDDVEKKLEIIEKEIEELKEKVEQEQAEPTMSSAEMSKEVEAIIEGAEKEMNKTEIESREEGLKEFIKEIVEKDEEGSDEEEAAAGEEKAVGVSVIAEKPKEDGKREGYVLDTTSLESPEEGRRQSRLHRGEILGRRKPDLAGGLTLLPSLIFTIFIFI